MLIKLRLAANGVSQVWSKRMSTTAERAPELRRASNGTAYEIYSNGHALANQSQRGVLAVCVHGNGLSRGIYRRMMEETIAKFPRDRPFFAISIDMAGHGASQRKDFHGYKTVGENAPDIAACVNDFRRSNRCGTTVLVGHSMGAHASLLAQLSQPDLFDAAFLIEPMIHPSWSSENNPTVFIEACKRRKTTFPSRQAAIEYFSPRGIFKSWEARCVEDYVDTGFERRDPYSPEVTICCSPVVEANNFSLDISEAYPRLEKIKLKKVLVFEGAVSGYLPPGYLEDITTKLRGTMETIEGGHHIVQSEKPALMADKLVTFINSLEIPPTFGTSRL